MRVIQSRDIKKVSRKKSAKKGDAGKLLVIGGSKEYVGAVCLASLAALRSGVDWVTIVAPEKVAYAINALSADLVTVKVKGDYFSSSHVLPVSKFLDKHNTVLLGNGITLKAKGFVTKIVSKISVPLIVDADAINVLQSDELSQSIITPHARELEEFMSNSGVESRVVNKILREKSLKKKSLMIQEKLKEFFKHDNVLLLKGPTDIIISLNDIAVVSGGNPGLAKAGTGDVLAGLCAGFVSQGLPLEQAAINASYYNKKIGDRLLKKHRGYSYIASDMVEEIKRIVRK